MGKGKAKGPSKGNRKREGHEEADLEDFLEQFSLSRQSLSTCGPYRLQAHRKGALCEARGEYRFDVTTGELTATCGGVRRSIGCFSAEPCDIEQPIDLDRLADAPLPCVTVLRSEVMREMQDPENANAFFVLPSQFNGVEFPSHCSVVDWVEDYKYDHTGGPCAQLAAHPGIAQFLLDNAATQRRPGGISATRRLLRKVNAELQERGICSKRQMFDTLNGYLKMPVPESGEVAQAALSSLQRHLPELRLLLVRDAPTSGLTPSKTDFSQSSHCANLVYASAVPINAYVNGIGAVAKGFGDAELHSFQRSVAEIFLVLQYYISLQVAAKAAKPKSKVFWMPLGGGAFNNSWESIVKCMALALEMSPALDLLDIYLLVYEGGRDAATDMDSETRARQLLATHQKLRPDAKKCSASDDLTVISPKSCWHSESVARSQALWPFRASLLPGCCRPNDSGI